MFPKKQDIYLFEALVDAFNEAANQNKERFQAHWDTAMKLIDEDGADPSTSHEISIMTHSSNSGTSNFSITSAELMFMAAPISKWIDIKMGSNDFDRLNFLDIDCQTIFPCLTKCAHINNWAKVQHEGRYDKIFNSVKCFSDLCRGGRVVDVGAAVFLSPWDEIGQLGIQELADIAVRLRERFQVKKKYQKTSEPYKHNDQEHGAYFFDRVSPYSSYNGSTFWKRMGLWASLQENPLSFWTGATSNPNTDQEIKSFFSAIELMEQTKNISGQKDKIPKKQPKI